MWDKGRVLYGKEHVSNALAISGRFITQLWQLTGNTN